jgi:hypothetical protein
MERSAKPIKAAKKKKALQQGEDGQVGQSLQSVPYRAASVRRVKKGQRNHQEPSSVYRVRRQLDGKPIKAAKKRKSPLARQRRPSQPRLAEFTVSSGLCEESKERSTLPSRTIKCVPFQAAAGWRGIAHQGGKDLQSVPYRTASVRRVKKGQRDQQVQSSGERVRRRLDGAHQGGRVEYVQCVPYRTAAVRRVKNSSYININIFQIQPKSSRSYIS